MSPRLLALAALALASCTVDERRRTSGDVPACSTDLDCPLKSAPSCVGGACVAADAGTPGCATNGDCSTFARPVCLARTCVPGCDSTSCPPRTVCDRASLLCVSPPAPDSGVPDAGPTPCSADGQCGAERVCEQQLCTSACFVDPSRCENMGLACGRSGHCQQAPPQTCVQLGCPAGMTCDAASGNCGPAATCAQVGCPPGMTCDAASSQCVPGATDGGAGCLIDAQCASGSVCTGGSCFPSCIATPFLCMLQGLACDTTGHCVAGPAVDAGQPPPPDAGVLCQTCTAQAQCGGNGNYCLSENNGASAFCGTRCGSDADCPPGGAYGCQQIGGPDGGTIGSNCVPLSGTCP